MKLIIAGSRHLSVSTEELTDILKEKLEHKYIWIEEIVCGCASGIDKCGENWAKLALLPVKRFPANWVKYGKSAGPRRNLQMAEYSDALLLIWDGISTGSANMKARMKGMGKPIFEVIKNV